MTIRWQLDELDEHFGAGGEVLKEDSEPLEDQAPQSSLRKTEGPKLSDLFPFSRRNQPMALCSVR